MTDIENRIQRGDDVVIAGAVEAVEWNRLLIATKGRDGVTRRHWIDPAEVKSWRPKGNGGKQK